MRQMQHDMTLIREYLNIHTTGRFKPNIIDPHTPKARINKNQ